MRCTRARGIFIEKEGSSLLEMRANCNGFRRGFRRFNGSLRLLRDQRDNTSLIVNRLRISSGADDLLY